MIEIDIVYEGQLRTRAAHGPSARELVTDAPTDNRGRGESYSPTDLVATALGTCMVTIMGMLAQDRGIALEGTKLRVAKHMVADPRRRIGRLDVTFDMAAGIPIEHRADLERAARTCPVAESISGRIELPIAFRYPD